MAPQVSVIIPVYNRLGLLQKAIASVCAQTFCDLELIVVDDGSTDGTYDWLCGQGIQTIRLAHSGYPGLVRNSGIKAAMGEYVALLDSDDLWMPLKLERQMAFFRAHPDISICHTREVWNRDGKIISQSGQRHRHSGMIFKDALDKCIIGPSTVVMRRDLLMEMGGFAPDLEIAEDYELWLHVTARRLIGYIDEPLVEKRGGHPDQLSNKYGQIEIFRIKALETALSRGGFGEQERQRIYEMLCKKCEIYARGARKRGKREEYQKYIQLARHYVQLTH